MKKPHRELGVAMESHGCREYHRYVQYTNSELLSQQDAPRKGIDNEVEILIRLTTNHMN